MASIGLAEGGVALVDLSHALHNRAAAGPLARPPTLRRRSMAVMRIAGRRTEVDAIVFDLFHTLVDPQEHVPPGFRRLAAVADILQLPEPDIELWWEQVVDELVSQPVSPIEALVDLARSRRIVLSPGSIAELDRAMGAGADAALNRPIAGAVEALRELSMAGIAIGVLSNALVRDVQVYLESPVAAVVDDACMSCFTGLAKPDPAAYHQALQRLGASPERSVFVGDGGSDEFKGARRTGFAAVIAITGAVERGGWRADSEQRRILSDADLAAESVSGLPALLEAGD